MIDSLPDPARARNAFGAHWQGSAPWFTYKLRTELHSRDDLTPLVVDSVALALLGELARRAQRQIRREPPAWLHRTRERLHDEFVRPPSLTLLAEAAGVHRVHLARTFREHFDCTIGEYVRQRRLDLACHQLAMSDAPLSEVALSVGFADQSHLTSTFKRVLGMPPGEFRRQLRANSR